MSWFIEGRPVNSILVSRLRYLGDVVMATPLLEVLRCGDPELRIGFLAEKNHGQVLLGHPNVDQLHLLDTERKGTDSQARSQESVLLNALSAGPMVASLREAQYDLAVDLFFNPRSAWLLRLASIRHRIGGTRGSRRWLYSHSVLPSEQPSRYESLFTRAPGGMGEHLARLAPLFHQPSNRPFLKWFQDCYQEPFVSPFLPRDFWQEQAAEPIISHNLSPIVLAPGATWSAKEWPAKHWRVLIEMLLNSTNNPIQIIQPPTINTPWSSLGDLIPENRGGVLPVLKLPEVLGVLSNCALLVSVDGGIMHAGIGLRVPVLGLFGPTDPALWFPYEKAGPYRVLSSNPHCAPCDLHECVDFICLPELNPSLVLEQCIELLASGGR